MVNIYAAVVWVVVAAACAVGFAVTRRPDYVEAAGVFAAVCLLSLILDVLQTMLHELRGR